MQRIGWLSGLVFLSAGVCLGAWIFAPEDRVRAFGEAVDTWLSPAKAQAQESKHDAGTETKTVSPVLARPRDTYYPNTEDLAPDEMRVIACGTGMPTTRAAQAAACFLVELGNGDKFLFDIGSGSAERISSLQIPYNYLNKVFIGHLHTDHFGSLHDLFIGGALMGRNVPLYVWGPSGATPELGTAYALDRMQEMLTWDLAGRVGIVDFRGYQMVVNEFDYKAENAVIYDENGVKIRSFPAIHSIDGSVSFSLEWNDLKFVFSSDTYPNKWFIEYAKDADIAIHECFIAVPDLVKKMRFTPESALLVGTQVHTAPEAFGKVMSEIKPRIAIAYHFFNDFDTSSQVYDRIRKTQSRATRVLLTTSWSGTSPRITFASEWRLLRNGHGAALGGTGGAAKSRRSETDGGETWCVAGLLQVHCQRCLGRSRRSPPWYLPGSQRGARTGVSVSRP